MWLDMAYFYANRSLVLLYLFVLNLWHGKYFSFRVVKYHCEGWKQTRCCIMWMVPNCLSRLVWSNDTFPQAVIAKRPTGTVIWLDPVEEAVPRNQCVVWISGRLVVYGGDQHNGLCNIAWWTPLGTPISICLKQLGTSLVESKNDESFLASEGHSHINQFLKRHSWKMSHSKLL